jgi:hypothetical protein
VRALNLEINIQNYLNWLNECFHHKRTNARIVTKYFFKNISGLWI